MTLYDLLSEIDFQQEIKIVKYDYKNDHLKEHPRSKQDVDVRYIYEMNHVIYIEVESEEET